MRGSKNVEPVFNDSIEPYKENWIKEKRMKKWYKSRTMLMNVIGVVVVVLTIIAGNETAVEFEAILLAALNLYMRLITSQGLKK